MDIRLLKLSNNKGEKDELTSQDILSIHLGYFMMKGKVTFSTDIAIADRPDYVILVLGNCPTYYWCRVVDYEYKNGETFTPLKNDFEEYSPDKYKGDENISWLLLDSIGEIPRKYLSVINKEIQEFVSSRANHKKIDL